MGVEESILVFECNILNTNQNITLLIIEPGFYHYELPEKIINIKIYALNKTGLLAKDIILETTQDTITLMIDKMKVSYRVVIFCEHFLVDEFRVTP